MATDANTFDFDRMDWEPPTQTEPSVKLLSKAVALTQKHDRLSPGGEHVSRILKGLRETGMKIEEAETLAGRVKATGLMMAQTAFAFFDTAATQLHANHIEGVYVDLHNVEFLDVAEPIVRGPQAVDHARVMASSITQIDPR